MTASPDPTCSVRRDSRIRGRWAPGESGNSRGRPPMPAWKRLDAQRNVYVNGVLDDRHNRLPDITARLLAALESRRIEIAGSTKPRHHSELDRVVALLNTIKFEDFA